MSGFRFSGGRKTNGPLIHAFHWVLKLIPPSGVSQRNVLDFCTLLLWAKLRNTIPENQPSSSCYNSKL